MDERRAVIVGAGAGLSAAIARSRRHPVEQDRSARPHEIALRPRVERV